MNIYLEAISAAKAAAETNRDECRRTQEGQGAPEQFAASRALTFLRSFVVPELTEARLALELCDLKADVGSGGSEAACRASLLIHGVAKPLTFSTSWACESRESVPVPMMKISDGVNPERECQLDPGEIRQAILAFVTSCMREIVRLC
ncbi:MAG: hypothetical protein JWL81_2855 [Verrucomicrobiales bacterium]|nr:hypothetical protein [Verrucomicrobiales bacterium]